MNAVPLASVPDFALARFNMVESQLRPNGITDTRILAAMGSVPREAFVPSYLAGVAYGDENIALIASRFLMQPMALARLIQAAEVADGDVVLDLAPATGYSTVVLAALTGCVVAVEPNALLHKEAEANIARLAAGRARALAGAPVEGGLAQGPFDVIFINGCVDFIPDFLFQQLAENGRLIAVVRKTGPVPFICPGEARLYRRQHGRVSETRLFDANVPSAPGFLLPSGFSF